MFSSNIKAHFVNTTLGERHEMSLDIADIRYRLFSCYGFIVNKKPDDNMRLSPDRRKLLSNDMVKHLIQDSGFFTFMFGTAKERQLTEQDHEDWQEKMIQFVKQNDLDCTVVEMDCQKTLGVEKAWKYRKQLKERLPNNRILNVFHVEDGRKGLDRLIEYSDYIALSIPELRQTHGGTYKKHTNTLAKYIKSKKPEIDIHLLGCTESDMMKQNSFCSTCDSSSWVSQVRYGRLSHAGKNVKAVGSTMLDTPEVRELRYRVVEESNKRGISTRDTTLNYNLNCTIGAIASKDTYERAAGSQQ